MWLGAVLLSGCADDDPDAARDRWSGTWLGVYGVCLSAEAMAVGATQGEYMDAEGWSAGISGAGAGWEVTWVTDEGEAATTLACAVEPLPPAVLFETTLERRGLSCGVLYPEVDGQPVLTLQRASPDEGHPTAVAPGFELDILPNLVSRQSFDDGKVCEALHSFLED